MVKYTENILAIENVQSFIYIHYTQLKQNHTGIMGINACIYLSAKTCMVCVKVFHCISSSLMH